MLGTGYCTDLDELYDNMVKLEFASLQKARERWKTMTVLIIDEISFVSGNAFSLLEEMARRIRDSDEFFGGIQIILLGKFFQLILIDEWWQNHPSGEYEVEEIRKMVEKTNDITFNGECWKKALLEKRFHHIYVTSRFRQVKASFFDMLTRIKHGKGTGKDFSRLEECIVKSMEHFPDDCMIVDPGNAKVNSINSKKIDRIDEKESDRVKTEYPKFVYKAKIIKKCKGVYGNWVFEEVETKGNEQNEWDDVFRTDDIHRHELRKLLKHSFRRTLEWRKRTPVLNLKNRKAYCLESPERGPVNIRTGDKGEVVGTCVVKSTRFGGGAHGGRGTRSYVYHCIFLQEGKTERYVDPDEKKKEQYRFGDVWARLNQSRNDSSWEKFKIRKEDWEKDGCDRLKTLCRKNAKAPNSMYMYIPIVKWDNGVLEKVFPASTTVRSGKFDVHSYQMIQIPLIPCFCITFHRLQASTITGSLGLCLKDLKEKFGRGYKLARYFVVGLGRARELKQCYLYGFDKEFWEGLAGEIDHLVIEYMKKVVGVDTI